MSTRTDGKVRQGRRGLTDQQLKIRKQRIRDIAPSEAWVDAAFQTISDVGPNGKPIHIRTETGEFPPPLMVRCPICDRFVPKIYLEQWTEIVRWQGIDYKVSLTGCPDDRESLDTIGYGPSPSAIAIQTLRNRKLKTIQSKLPPEKASKLRQEIKRFEKTGKLPQ